MQPIKNRLDTMMKQLGTLSERFRLYMETEDRKTATEDRKMKKLDELLTRTDWNVPHTMHRLDSIERSQKKNEHDIEMIKKGQARIEEKLEKIFIEMVKK